MRSRPDSDTLQRPRVSHPLLLSKLLPGAPNIRHSTTPPLSSQYLRERAGREKRSVGGERVRRGRNFLEKDPCRRTHRELISILVTTYTATSLLLSLSLFSLSPSLSLSLFLSHPLSSRLLMQCQDKWGGRTARANYLRRINGEGPEIKEVPADLVAHFLSLSPASLANYLRKGAGASGLTASFSRLSAVSRANECVRSYLRGNLMR